MFDRLSLLFFCAHGAIFFVAARKFFIHHCSAIGALFVGGSVPRGEAAFGITCAAKENFAFFGLLLNDFIAAIGTFYAHFLDYRLCIAALGE